MTNIFHFGLPQCILLLVRSQAASGSCKAEQHPLGSGGLWMILHRQQKGWIGFTLVCSSRTWSAVGSAWGFTKKWGWNHTNKWPFIGYNMLWHVIAAYFYGINWDYTFHFWKGDLVLITGISGHKCMEIERDGYFIKPRGLWGFLSGRHWIVEMKPICTCSSGDFIAAKPLSKWCISAGPAMLWQRNCRWIITTGHLRNRFIGGNYHI